MPSKMTWEEKLEALQELGNVNLIMRKPGDWFVHHPGVEPRFSHFLGGPYGNGSTPQEAVENHWRIIALREHPRYTGDKRIVAIKVDNSKYVQWSGYMWKEISKDLVEVLVDATM